MRRLYEEVARRHLLKRRQMLFLVGPRQVGKTTTSLALEHTFGRFVYLNWDVVQHRALLSGKAERLERFLGLDQLGGQPGLIVLDEIHKSPKWKDFLKGFFDAYGHRSRILVTGSARLDLLKYAGDSLMGRYFLHRLHPFTVAEVVDPTLIDGLVRAPRPVDSLILDRLLEHGGFPEPYMENDPTFTKQWRRIRFQQLFRGELSELSHVRELAQIELLGEILRRQTGQLCNYASLATHVQVSGPTIRKWIELLKAFFYCYTIPPWSRNIPRSLIKDPKLYLWDWSIIVEPGARFENMMASHLLKAVHHWTDSGMGEFALHFLRDKEKREVDFLVSRDGEPWLLVEAKLSLNHGLSSSLRYFQEKTGAPYALQVVLEADAIDETCFVEGRPMIVPASTFLSQLV